MTRFIPTVLIAAGILLFGTVVASALTPPPADPVEIEAELKALVEEHEVLVEEHDALVEWVAEELEPWVEEVEEVVEPSPGPPVPGEPAQSGSRSHSGPQPLSDPRTPSHALRRSGAFSESGTDP